MRPGEKTCGNRSCRPCTRSRVHLRFVVVSSSPTPRIRPPRKMPRGTSKGPKRNCSVSSTTPRSGQAEPRTFRSGRNPDCIPRPSKKPRRRNARILLHERRPRTHRRSLRYLRRDRGSRPSRVARGPTPGSSRPHHHSGFPTARNHGQPRRHLRRNRWSFRTFRSRHSPSTSYRWTRRNRNLCVRCESASSAGRLTKNPYPER